MKTWAYLNFANILAIQDLNALVQRCLMPAVDKSLSNQTDNITQVFLSKKHNHNL